MLAVVVSEVRMQRSEIVHNQGMKRIMKRILLALSAVCVAVTTPYAVAQTKPAKHFIVYLPFYRQGDMGAALAATNLTGVTDIDIAFVAPPLCSGPCTSASDFTISADSHTDAEVDAVVGLAHAKGISVMASIGGGGGGVSEIAQFYNARLSAPLVALLTEYVHRHKLDGIDVDIETSDNMGAPYADFVAKLITAMHAEGKLVSCATAKYIQASMPQATLLSFDYISLMVYSNLKDAQDALNFFELCSVSASMGKLAMMSMQTMWTFSMRTRTPIVSTPWAAARSKTALFSTTSARTPWPKRRSWPASTEALWSGNSSATHDHRTRC